MSKGYYVEVREVSQDIIHLLEDLIDLDLAPSNKTQHLIQDHEDLLRGVTRDVSIIAAVYSKSHKFLKNQMEILKSESKFTQAVLCRVMANRVRNVIIASLKETQPIDIYSSDEDNDS